MRVPSEIAGEFFDYLVTDFDGDPDTIVAHPQHVLDIVWYWLSYGHGVSRCSNDYSIFLSAVICIADEWVKNRQIIPHCIATCLDMDEAKFEPSPSVILDEECSFCTDVLDPQFFTRMAHDPEYYIRRRTVDEEFAKENGMSQHGTSRRLRSFPN